MNQFIEQQSRRITGLVDLAGERARRMPGASVLEQTLQAYNEDRGSLFAAALSYYGLLSIFPFMLFLLAISSPFLASEEAIRIVSGTIGGYFPTGPQVIRNTLHEVTQLRGAISIAAAAGFLWSASSVFNVLQLAINRAFRVQRPRPVWRERMVSLGMVIFASLLFAASFLDTTAIRLGIHYEIVARHDLLIQYFQVVSGIAAGFMVFGLIYRYVPYDSGLRWRHVWQSALLASIFWEIAKLGFAWYITNLALLNLVYGSLGAIIALMLWGYVTAVILLMCAELAAVRAGARQRERTGKEWWAATAMGVAEPVTNQHNHQSEGPPGSRRPGNGD